MTALLERVLDSLIQIEQIGRSSAHYQHNSNPAAVQPKQDKALERELVSGVLRWRAQIDHILSRSSKRLLPSLSPRLRNALRLGVYQLLYLQGKPDYAVIHSTVELAGLGSHQGIKSYANAVLRSVQRRGPTTSYLPPKPNTLQELALVHSYPEWLLQRWGERFGIHNTAALCQWNNQHHPLALRVNPRCCRSEELRERLHQAGFTLSASEWLADCVLVEKATGIFDTPEFTQGWFTVQDEPSQIAVLALDVQPDEQLLDACSGPGGKTCYLAMLAGAQGSVVAVDRNHRAVTLLEQTKNRLGVLNIKALHGDILLMSNQLLGRFTKIVVDAPCSGLGTIHRHPEIKWTRDQDSLTRLRGEQLALLTRVAELLNERGVIMYSVCSFEPEETTEVIAEFLRVTKGFELARIRFENSKLDSLVNADGFLEVLPYPHQLSGFFGAMLKKVG